MVDGASRLTSTYIQFTIGKMSYNSEQEKRNSIGEDLDSVDEKVLRWLALIGGDLSKQCFSRFPLSDLTNLDSSTQQESPNRSTSMP